MGSVEGGGQVVGVKVNRAVADERGRMTVAMEEAWSE